MAVITANWGSKEVERRRSICKWFNVTFGLRNIAVLVLRYNCAAKRRLDLMRVSKMRV